MSFRSDIQGRVFLEIGRAIWKKFYAIPEIDLYNVGVN
jgi:hypothetical protein